MKRISTLLAAVMLTGAVWAQSPEMMSYQAVIRNSGNALVSNQSVGMRVSILQGSESGTSVYTETHTATTNINGLVSIEIGTGSTSDDFESIDWSGDIYFIKTETDPTGGTNYTITGTSQLMSVPYALYAKTSGSSTPGPKGDKGDQGDQGLQGLTGAKGDQGDQGLQGLTGAKGDQGDQGLQGLTGAKGDQGDQGLQGLAGEKGDQGDQGLQGLTGAKGDQGDQGLQGLTGEKGDKGDQGDTGLLLNGTTAGNTPYWNGTAWVTNNSNIHNNGGNVGIGTSNPTSAKLVVSTTPGAQGIDLSTTDGYANMRVIQNTNSSFDKDLYLGFNSGTTSSLHLYSNNGETMTVKGGNVGIGTSDPGIPLNFANTLGDKIALWGNSGSTYGFGIQGGLLQIHSDQSGSDVAFGYGSSAAFTETMRIKGTGNVGIGTATPNEKFEIVGASLRTALRSAAENQDVTLFLGTPFNTDAKNKVAIIADAQGTFSRANLLFCVNGVADNTNEVGVGDSKMMIDYNGNVSVGSSNQFQVNATGNVTKINNVATSFPATQGGASTVLQNDGSGNLTWATPAAGGGTTFRYQFSGFSNSSCCNDRIHQGNGPAAAASIFENSTQPKHSYGETLAEDVEVVEVRYLIQWDDFTPTGAEALTIQPAIANFITGALDRQLTAAIDLRTATANQWITLPLLSSDPTDNLVDASELQYVVWQQNTTMTGGGNLDGRIYFDVRVKNP